jgi:hypothetical protein
MKLDDLIVQNDLSIEQKLDMAGQVILTHDDQIEQLKVDVADLMKRLTMIENIAGIGK